MHINNHKCSREAEALARAYYWAKRYLLDNGYADEIDWQESVKFQTISEQDFLRESAWVVLCSGIRESVIRKKFDAISIAYFNWKSSDIIAQNIAECSNRALNHFNNQGKIRAINQICQTVNLLGFKCLKEEIQRGGVHYLERFPFIGPITSLHLAKNLGFNVAKPDRHLTRMSSSMGFGSAQELCEFISNVTSDSVAVIDLVIWRYSSLHPRIAYRFANSFTGRSY